MPKVVCLGPGPQFKGGISNYNTSLAKAFDQRHDTEVHIVSWSQQYPAIVPREFIDKTSKKDFLEGTDIQVEYILNYNHPSTWRKTAKRIAALEPDVVVIQWYNAQQGLPLSYINKYLKKHSKAKVYFDLHFVVPKENSAVDTWFTKRGLRSVDRFIAHAYSTVDELQGLFPKKDLDVTEDGTNTGSGTPVIKLFHPIYDLFEPEPDFDVAAFKREHDLKEHVFLFFGFIRKYKGLHHAIRAFAELAAKRDDVSLMICGESFWNTLDASKFSTKVKNFLFGLFKSILLKKEDDEKDYRPLELIEESGIQDRVLLVNEFIPNEDVPKYFQTADSIVLFYERATPSGVESLSYNFDLPILATEVGHFPETVTNGFNGYLAHPGDIQDMARVMEKSITEPIDKVNVARSAEHMSWERYVKAILTNSRS
ncbi:MAG: glycosyltransferase family 4 protein [Flavobacteriales bacterium]|nr:glycosyltransferase family 4 protein [Flavobacteriales bacterium]